MKQHERSGMNISGSETQNVQVRAGDVTLEGSLNIPADASGIVVFVHGSGSSRHSPRNQYVASTFNEGGLGTLLFDLLTLKEEQIDQATRHLRFDISMLARRTVGAADWLAALPDAGQLKVGFFGSSTGAAAALIAAAERPQLTRAVVSRGGRPDLAALSLDRVAAPVLLLVGELDQTVIGLNEEALSQLPETVEKRLEIIPGATHLFEEPGTLEQAAARARDWFQTHFNSRVGRVP